MDLQLQVFSDYERERAFETEFIGVLNKLDKALKVMILSTDHQSDFGFFYERMDIVLENWGLKLVEMERRYFDIIDNSPYDLSIIKTPLHPLFVQHAAKSMVGRRNELLKLAEKTDGFAKEFLKEVLHCHLVNLTEQDLSNTALWKLKSGQKTVAYLYPSAHNIAQKITNCPNFLIQAAQECNCFAIESLIDTNQLEEFQKKFWIPFLSEYESWPDVIKLYLHKKKNIEIDTDSINLSSFEKFNKLKSCSLEESLLKDVMIKMKQTGVPPIHGLENDILTFSKRGLFLNIGTILLKWEMKTSGLYDTYEEVVSAAEDWLQGDIEKLTKSRLQFVEKLELNLPKGAILDTIKNSNKEMVRSTEKIINSGLTPFVVVGAAHFGGEDGILELFKKIYDLERVN